MLADTLKDIRRRNYLNQTAFANKIGVTQSAVSQWENGLTRPNSDQLMAISSAFGISVDEILSGDDSKEEDNRPKTPEARAVSFGMDTLPQEQRQLILSMVRAMYPDNFKSKGTKDDDT